MITKGRKKGTMRFVYGPTNSVKKVALAGNFNNWQPTTMRKQKDGSYVASIPLSPGSHQYKFVVDGKWINDPDNHACVVNEHGTLNSVLVVE